MIGAICWVIVACSQHAYRNRVIGLNGNVAFGNVAVGQNASATLTITNTGNSTLTMSGMTVSNSASVVSSSFATGTIAAGASQTATIRFSPDINQGYSAT